MHLIKPHDSWPIRVMLYLEEPFSVAIYRMGPQTKAGLIKCDCFDIMLDRFITNVVHWKDVCGDDDEELARAAVDPTGYMPSYGDLRRWVEGRKAA